MTETAFLPGSLGTDSDSLVPESEDGDPGQRRKLLMLGGAAGAVVLVAAGYFLLHGHSASTSSAFVPVHHPASQPAAGKDHAAKGQTAPSTLPKRAKVHMRDPFAPLVVAPVTSGTSTGTTNVPAGSGSATSSTDSSTSGSPLAGSTPPVAATAPSAGPTAVPTSGNNGIPAGHPRWIQLVKTNGVRAATFKVGYPHHTFHVFKVQAPQGSSAKGTVFGGEFDLIGVQGNQVTLQIGDATPFDLSKGIAHEIG